MYKIEDNFYPYHTFQLILNLIRERPDNQVPENYDGKRISYGEARQYLTEDSELLDLILSKFPYKKDYRRKIEICNDVDGFWLKPHSDHPAKREVTVIYFEGLENNGITFFSASSCTQWENLKQKVNMKTENNVIKKNYKEDVDLIPNRAVHFYPNSLDTYDDEWEGRHSVKKIEITVRRTVVVNYVDNTWTDIKVCYDR
tara:strand:- start:246 stop:845 length:600 start_codon:yes stop_codon:yes gene_type:complete